MSLPQVEQPLLKSPIPEGLPSQTDQTLSECPRFRIILIGNVSGVGKSSLVRYIFNVDPKKIDVAHDRAGDADIERGYESYENPRFILHDSKGFQEGLKTTWEDVERFLRKRQAHTELSRRIHAIWFCLQTPRKGARLLEAGDERLLELAIELNIPIIAVFTKYDLLVKQFLINDKSGKPKQERLADSERKALDSLDSSVEKLHDIWKKLSSTEIQMACVKMSISKDTDTKLIREMLINLTNVTRAKLRDVEGELWIPWAAAQQVNALKVSRVVVLIFTGLSGALITDTEYWLDLGQSVAFEGQTIINSIRRIHDDVLKVWNFNDPNEILSGQGFITEMIGLVAPLIDNQTSTSQADSVSTVSDLIDVIEKAGATALVLPLSAISLGVLAIKFLYGKYQRFDSVAKLLATYIVNLILILHGIFMDILPSDPPRALSHSLVADALTYHKSNLQTNPFDDVNSTSGFAINAERIASVIKTRLRLPQDQ
ncbi:hypothetical protein AN958_06472 [Leucoagaricus sp. SymC.cos]|nr:hypothetical protein AN958_06472 [Leucoagaricus sp. SymC.cos]